MRATRIVSRWNLKSRAKAGRYLQNWQDRLSQGARNLYVSGYQDAILEAASKGDNDQPSLSPPPPPETAHSNGLQQGVDRSSSGGSLILIPGEHL